MAKLFKVATRSSPLAMKQTQMAIDYLAGKIEGADFEDFLNPRSLEERDILIEPALAAAKAGDHIQFERNAYFTPDSKLSAPDSPVFNRTVALKDSYGK